MNDQELSVLFRRVIGEGYYMRHEWVTSGGHEWFMCLALDHMCSGRGVYLAGECKEAKRAIAEYMEELAPAYVNQCAELDECCALFEVFAEICGLPYFGYQTEAPWELCWCTYNDWEHRPRTPDEVHLAIEQITKELKK